MAEDIPPSLPMIMHSALFSKVGPGPSQYGLEFFEVLHLDETMREAQQQQIRMNTVANIATGETSSAIVPFHCFGYFNCFGFHHKIISLPLHLL